VTAVFKWTDVGPLGANLTSEPDRRQVVSLIEKRPRRECRLLFVGVDWHRKGGDLALRVVERLVEMGIPSRLTVVGCRAGDVPQSRLVEYVGFIDKSTPSGEASLVRLLGDSHFLCLPSRAECSAIVFSEASAYGLPSIAIRTGGVASAVRHTGQTASFSTRPVSSRAQQHPSRIAWRAMTTFTLRSLSRLTRSAAHGSTG